MTEAQLAALAAAGACLLLAAALVVAELSLTCRKDRPTALLSAALVCDTAALVPVGYLVVTS